MKVKKSQTYSAVSYRLFMEAISNAQRELSIAKVQVKDKALTGRISSLLLDLGKLQS